MLGRRWGSCWLAFLEESEAWVGLGKGAKAERVEKTPGRTFSRAAPGTAREKEARRLIAYLKTDCTRGLSANGWFPEVG